MVKPKKFFKSRNAAPTTIEEQRPEPIAYRQVPDSHYGRGRPSKQSHQSAAKQQMLSKSSSIAQSKKIQESLSNANQVPKDEGKPPIVLRICKGTARLICGDTDSDADTYRVSPLESPTKLDFERKSPPKTMAPSVITTTADTRTTRSTAQPIVTTVSIPLEESETRRTTRSRAKNLRDIISPTTVAPTPPVNTNTHSSGLSLTLRKSVTDSNNTVIAHYDIVKTETNFTGKPQVEPLIGRDQPLPTTTQELIDILSNDPEGQRQMARPMETNYEEQEEIFEEILQYSEEPSTKVAEDEEEDDDDDDDEEEEEEDDYEREYEQIKEVEDKELTPLRDDADVPTAKTMVDQDWFSGSEDSESAIGNVENEVPVQRDEKIRVQPSPPPRNDVSASKPTTKKGSIFKSRSAGTTNGNKRRALYKHKWSDNDKESPAADTGNTGNEIPNTASSSHTDSSTVAFDEFGSDELTRVVTYPETGMDLADDDLLAVTSIRCDKKVKGVSIFYFIFLLFYFFFLIKRIYRKHTLSAEISKNN